MKAKILRNLTIAALSATLLAGCGMLPKNVAFFQKEVKAVPTKSENRQELERQAVAMLEDKIAEAQLAAVVTKASTNVVAPLKDAAVVSEALSTSVGPPLSDYIGKPEKLASSVEKAVAKDNVKLDKYRKDNAPLVGKEIEGTGWEINYFLYTGLCLGGIFMLIVAIRIGWSIFVNSYPGVGVGLNMLKIPGRAAAKGLSEVLEGGEHFKEAVKGTKDFEDAVKAKVLDLFKRAQVEKQSRDTQSVIKRITS